MHVGKKRIYISRTTLCGGGEAKRIHKAAKGTTRKKGE